MSDKACWTLTVIVVIQLALVFASGYELFHHIASKEILEQYK